MKIKELYEQLATPPHLQEHMMRVAHIGLFFYDHWTGEKLNKKRIIQAALLHDVGNVVRFTSSDTPSLQGGNDIEYWKRLQKDVITRYGTDDHTATEMMLTEAGVEKTIIQIILDKSFANSVRTQTMGSWELKILSYADMRVIPSGITSLEERIQDLFARVDRYKNRTDKEELIHAIYAIEQDIQRNISVSIIHISPNVSAEEADEFLNVEIDGQKA